VILTAHSMTWTAIELDPKIPQTYYNRGRVYTDKHQYEGFQ